MRQLDPKAVWFFFFSFLSRTLALALILSLWATSFFSEFKEYNEISSISDFFSGFFNWFWIIVPISTLLCFVWAKLTYHFYRYELLDTGFRKESGVIYKKYTTIPYSRIQNVDINRGILARILGLSDLNIQTAGASATISRYGVMGGDAEGRLPAVSKADGEYLRDELIQKANQSKNQGI